MTPSFLADLIAANREPPAAATIRQQAAEWKALAAGMTEAERQAAKYEAYRLTADWWRAVRGGEKS